MRLPLIQGAYTARSVIADAQRSVNLYAEANPKDSLVPLTHYGAPGLTLLGAPPTPGLGRGLYWANSGVLFATVGNNVYSVSPSWQFTLLGTIETATGITSMADNGTTAILVDGSVNGYQINLADNTFSPVSAATNAPPPSSGLVYAFYGADRVDIIDGFMVFNQPGTQNFYCTQDNNVIFDALNFAAKNGYSDNLVSIIVTLREIVLIGQRTTEFWFDAGGANFPFQIFPGPFIQHGCSAKYSVAQIDGTVFWLSQDQSGNNIVVEERGYIAKEASNPALTAEWNTYTTTADAQGFCFQLGAHIFYQINFPTADRSWRYDKSTGLWHEALYIDSNGIEHRHRVSVGAYAYGLNVGLDWETGALYQIDQNAYTDAGAPMYFRRGFPHIMNDGKRVIYPGFSLDVQAATSPATVAQTGPLPLLDQTGTPIESALPEAALLAGPAPVNNAPLIWLRWSDDRGETYSQPVAQSLGATGQTLVQPKWSRLGMARDRVFEIYGQIPGKLAINGAFLDPAPITMVS